MIRIVVKIGSSLVASLDSEIGLNLERINSLALDIAGAIKSGYQVVVVSSGAVAAGRKKLGLTRKDLNIMYKQAAAAIGQTGLINAYEQSFQEHGHRVAQILLTGNVIADRLRYVNARNTILTLLSLGVIPIINENDSVAVDEIKFGDNDNLAAIVSGLIDAHMLVILSDVDGLYSKNPNEDINARLITNIPKVDNKIKAIAGDSSNAVGTGGMFSKVLAAQRATGYGIPVVIMSGRKQGLLCRLLYGESIGSFFEPVKKRLSSRKRWIAHGINEKGIVVIDEGAAKAVTEQGKSLLPTGILAVRGQFKIGDSICCISLQGETVARGITNYSSEDLAKIKGEKSNRIESILGYKYSDEVIHRDNLVLDDLTLKSDFS